jgi:excisionase family DNA binding protein
VVVLADSGPLWYAWRGLKVNRWTEETTAMPDDAELLTIKQVAELTGLSRERIQLLCMADRIPCDREGGRRNARYLIRRGDVKALRDDKTRAGNYPTQSQHRVVGRVVPAVAQPKEGEQSNTRSKTATPDGRGLLTVTEVAEMLGVPRHSISYLCVTGRIPCIRDSRQMRRRYLIRRRDAEALRERFRRDTISADDRD